MTKPLSAFIAVLLLTTSAVGQLTAQKANNELAFSTINQLGLLTGSNGQAATVQTINGVSMNTWFAGIGVGIDYYGTRGIPLFFDIRKELFSKKNSPFIYADAGLHLPWASQANMQSEGYIGTSENGAYFDAGVGLKLQTNNIGAILLSAGFSYKKVSDKAEMYNIWSWPTQPVTYEYYKYHYRRIVIKVGIQL